MRDAKCNRKRLRHKLHMTQPSVYRSYEFLEEPGPVVHNLSPLGEDGREAVDLIALHLGGLDLCIILSVESTCLAVADLEHVHSDITGHRTCDNTGLGSLSGREYRLSH